MHAASVSRELTQMQLQVPNPEACTDTQLEADRVALLITRFQHGLQDSQPPPLTVLLRSCVSMFQAFFGLLNQLCIATLLLKLWTLMLTAGLVIFAM